MDMASAERAKVYRLRAQEVRNAAQDIKHLESRAALMRLAASYDRVADNIEKPIRNHSALKISAE
jgi:hypothetical protein